MSQFHDIPDYIKQDSKTIRVKTPREVRLEKILELMVRAYYDRGLFACQTHIDEAIRVLKS